MAEWQNVFMGGHGALGGCREPRIDENQVKFVHLSDGKAKRRKHYMRTQTGTGVNKNFFGRANPCRNQLRQYHLL